jgi:hypothetical protein
MVQIKQVLGNDFQEQWCILYDDTTRARSLIAAAVHEAGRNPRQSLNQVRVCEDCNRVRNLSCL